jgi:hypothetical protein
MRNKTYEERLTELKLPTLEFRRRRGDLIQLYKIVNDKHDNKVTDGLIQFSDRTSRGNSKKILVQYARLETRKNSFFHRTVKDWNQLPEEIAAAEDTKTFERLLDKFLTHKISPYRPPQY